MNSDEIQPRFFAVGNAPFCLWNLKGSNSNFLQTIDTHYFEYLGKTHAANLEGENKQRAAIAIRIAYFHGLETLFMLIFATLQAPGAVTGWLLKCRSDNLRDLVIRVAKGEKFIIRKWKLKEISWAGISSLINGAVFSGHENSESFQTGFADLWEKFAGDFTDEFHIDEYNGIKHGFRANAGTGPCLSFTSPKKPDETSLTLKPIVFSSDYGTSFPVAVKLKDAKIKDLNHHFCLKHCHVNLQPTLMVSALFMISMSIGNIVSFLRLVNGTPSGELKNFFPLDKQAFGLFSQPRDSIVNLAFNHTISEENIIPFTKQHILEHLTRETPNT